MGISRDSKHKKRATGGKPSIHRKKRKFELGRPAANTKIGTKRIHPVRARGGHIKHRALRLESGNYSWGSEAVTRKTRILGVVYNSTNNELVRTNTLVKNSIVQIDATPFRQWYEQHYGVGLGAKKSVVAAAAAAAATAAAAAAAPKKEGEKTAEAKAAEGAAAAPADAKTGAAATTAAPAKTVAAESAKKRSPHVKRKLAKRGKGRVIDPLVEEQFTTGRLYACIASRPGQSGRADGYVLEGKELEFYVKKMQKGKKGKAGKE